MYIKELHIATYVDQILKSKYCELVILAIKSFVFNHLNLQSIAIALFGPDRINHSYNNKKN